METDREYSSVVHLPQFPGPSIVTRRAASDDPDTSTAETVELMAAAAEEDSNSPQVWAATQGALTGVTQAVTYGGNGERAKCEAVYRWIASHVKFRSDDPVLSHVLGLENELDLLIRPARLLTMSRPAEDCDGFTMLACSMLLAAGIPCEIVTIKADHDEPERFSHVYCQALLEDGSALVMDCSQGAQHGFPCGWEAPDYFDRKTWGVLHPQHQKGLHGLNGLDEVYDYGGEYGAIAPSTATAPSGGAFDFSNLINQSFKFASQLALRPGQYVQNAQGVMASNVPGAIPGQYPANVGVNLGGVSSSTLLLGGAALLAVLLLSGRK